MRRDLLLIAEMIDASRQTELLVAGTDLQTLAHDRQRRDALLWNFTVLGEAAAQVHDEIQERFPEVEWSQPSHLRNRVVHGYWSIDLEVLHTTATDLLPAFVEQLRFVLRELESDAGRSISRSCARRPLTCSRRSPNTWSSRATRHHVVDLEMIDAAEQAQLLVAATDLRALARGTSS